MRDFPAFVHSSCCVMFELNKFAYVVPVVSKIQEHCVASRLVPFIKDSIYSLQHGFQSRKSCTSQFQIHEIGQSLDKGLECDLEKAFDSVCFTKLLTKLECYSISDPLLKWFKSYPHGRLQRVVINGLCSAWKLNMSNPVFLRGPCLDRSYCSHMSMIC